MDLLTNCTSIKLNDALLSNCTSTNEDVTPFEFSEAEVLRWVRIVAYGLVFIFGVVGNLMVVLAFRQPKMKTVPNIFISNLAIADGVVSLVNVPLVALHGHLSYWPYGEFLCKLLPFLQGVSLAASVGTMMAISIDRYMVIVRYDRPKLTLFKAKIWIGVIWLLSFIFPSPIIAYSIIVSVPVKGVLRPKCVENWPNPASVRAFSMMVFVVLYCLPLLITCSLYGLIAKAFKNLPTAQKVSHKHQHRIVRMFVVVVFVFALCWLPYHVVFLYMDYALTQLNSTIISLVLFAQCLIYANSACNPIVYAVFNTNYRRQFIHMLRFRFTRDYSISRTLHGPKSIEAHPIPLSSNQATSSSHKVTKTIERQNSCPHPCHHVPVDIRRPTI